ALQQEVIGVPRVSRDLHRRAPVPELSVDARLELLQALRLDVRRPRGTLDHRANVAADDGARERRELLPEERLVPGLTVRAPELDFRPLPEEPREAVRGRRPREQVIVARVAVGARTFGAEPRREEQPLLQREE